MDDIEAMLREERMIRERQWWKNYMDDFYGESDPENDDYGEPEEDPEWDDKPRWVVYPDETEEDGGTIYEPNV